MSKNKLRTEERIKAVESYIRGTMGLSEVLRTYAVPISTFEKWVHKYLIIPCGKCTFKTRGEYKSAE